MLNICQFLGFRPALIDTFFGFNSWQDLQFCGELVDRLPLRFKNTNRTFLSNGKHPRIRLNTPNQLVTQYNFPRPASSRDDQILLRVKTHLWYSKQSIWRYTQLRIKFFNPGLALNSLMLKQNFLFSPLVYFIRVQNMVWKYPLCLHYFTLLVIARLLKTAPFKVSGGWYWPITCLSCSSSWVFFKFGVILNLWVFCGTVLLHVHL